MSIHYKLIYDAVKANGGVVEDLYQEYCTYCKSENIKPLEKISMPHYIAILVAEGKLIREGGGKYKAKEKSVNVKYKRS